MGTLRTLWRGRSGRLWRLSLDGVPIGGDPGAAGEVIAETDLSSAPVLSYGEGSRRRGPAVLGSSVSLVLAGDDALAEQIGGVDLPSPATATVPPRFVAAENPSPALTEPPNVRLESGRLATTGSGAGSFEGDVDAGRAVWHWSGYLDGPPLPEGDERGLPALALRASCGLAGWSRQTLTAELAESFRFETLFALPGAAWADVDILVDAYAENRRQAGDTLWLAALARLPRAEIAADLLSALQHRVWRPAWHEAGAYTAYRIAPVWRAPSASGDLLAVAGDPDDPPTVPTAAVVVALAAGDRPVRDTVPAEVMCEERTSELSYGYALPSDVPRAGSFVPDGDTAEVFHSETADLDVPELGGLLRNGEFLHWSGSPLRPEAFLSGGTLTRVLDGDDYRAELGASGWVWQAGPAADESTFAALSCVASGTGDLRVRLLLHGVSGAWYAGNNVDGWVALASAPTPGDASPTGPTVTRSLSGRDRVAAIPEELLPEAGRLYAEAYRVSGAPRLELARLAVYRPAASQANLSGLAIFGVAGVEQTESYVSTRGDGDAETLPTLPPVYVTGEVDVPATNRPPDVGVEAGRIVSAETARVFGNATAYALATAAALRVPATGPATGALIEERDAFGLVSPDRLAVVDGRRFAVQAAALDLRDEVTDGLTLYQVPVWRGGAWDWTPET